MEKLNCSINMHGCGNVLTKKKELQIQKYVDTSRLEL